MTRDRRIDQYFDDVTAAFATIERAAMAKFVRVLRAARAGGKTVLAFGNGGSGATASHFCGDLVMGCSVGCTVRFRAVCLNDNIPALMAVANDYAYEDIFVEQLKNFVQPGDVVVGISGSGNSMNVVKALQHASDIGATTVALCGYRGGKIKEIADIVIHADVQDMEMSEDVHVVILHCVKKMLLEPSSEAARHAVPRGARKGAARRA